MAAFEIDKLALSCRVFLLLFPPAARLPPLLLQSIIALASQCMTYITAVKSFTIQKCGLLVRQYKLCWVWRRELTDSNGWASCSASF